MKNLNCRVHGGLLALIGLVFSFTLSAAEPDAVLTLFDGSQSAALSAITTDDAQASQTSNGAVQIKTGHQRRWPGISLKAPSGKWNLASYRSVILALSNSSPRSVTIHCRVDNPGADGTKNCVTGSTTLAAGAVGMLQVNLSATPWRLSKPIRLVGVRAAPGQPDDFDPANVTQLLVFVNEPKEDHQYELKNIVAAGRATVLDADSFFPFIDVFGQFRHADWPGKTHSLQDLALARQAEEADLAEHPGPLDRDQYGGWMAGPILKATGFFHAAKRDGKWWLVDPLGRLFWSHGIDCVGSSETTPVSERENYFQDLPLSDSFLARFYGQAAWAPHGFYREHSPYKTYDFSRANLWRKYGDQWEKASSEVIHRRLKSWGMNTIANWSSTTVALQRKTPYVCTLNNRSRNLEGSEGYWGKFFDVFDPSFQRNLQQRLQREVGVTAGDPWCLGYFVDNELGWGSETSLAEATLKSPQNQPAKLAFLADLKAKYQGIDKLNASWGSEYASWEAWLKSPSLPDRTKAGPDLTVFYTRTAETYFRTIREELKKVAPHQLYLGCRFAWVNDRAVEAAAKFCDVISFNRYEYSVANLMLPAGLDKPVIIGEFHFGALDRGMFHTGLRSTANQADRADKYRTYVEGALANKLIVGTHWFQYQDQATTGRGDGENYQIGFVDVADHPYTETIQACRDIGYRMYEFRTRASAP